MSELEKGNIGEGIQQFILKGWISSNNDAIQSGFFGGKKIEINRFIMMKAQLFMMASSMGYSFSSKRGYEIAKWAVVNSGGNPDYVIENIAKNINDKYFQTVPNPNSLYDLIVSYNLALLGKTHEDMFKGRITGKLNFDLPLIQSTEMEIVSAYCFGLSDPKMYKKLTKSPSKEEWDSAKEFGLNLNSEYKSEDEINKFNKELFLDWAKQSNPYVFNNLT